VLEPWAKLQAMLQGILQGAGPVGCYKVLTGRVVEREFRGAGPRFWAFPGCFVSRSSFLEWSAATRPTVACIGRESRAKCFEGISGRGSVR
jgi:hypothetical protein